MTNEELTIAEEIAITNMIGKNPETLARCIVEQDRIINKQTDKLKEQFLKVNYHISLYVDACGHYDRACDVLESLFALVMGECPSLLEGHFLYDQIKEVLE